MVTQFKSIFLACFFLFMGLFCLNISFASAALEEDEVLVIANSWADDSVSLAKYYMKKRGELYRKLGGRCYMCHTKKKLMVHRVYKQIVDLSKNGAVTKVFETEIGDEITMRKLSEEEMKSKAKELHKNPDNMVLLCTECFKYAVKAYGRKRRIGKRQLYDLMRE